MVQLIFKLFDKLFTLLAFTPNRTFSYVVTFEEIKFPLKCPFPYHILWRLIYADVDAANVFADESEQKHNHAAYEEYGGEHAGVTDGNFGEHQFFVDDEEACRKANDSAD